jgi:hypothetical protein
LTLLKRTAGSCCGRCAECWASMFVLPLVISLLCYCFFLTQNIRTVVA